MLFSKHKKEYLPYYLLSHIACPPFSKNIMRHSKRELKNRFVPSEWIILFVINQFIMLNKLYYFWILFKNKTLKNLSFLSEEDLESIYYTEIKSPWFSPLYLSGIEKQLKSTDILKWEFWWEVTFYFWMEVLKEYTRIRKQKYVHGYRKIFKKINYKQIIKTLTNKDPRSVWAAFDLG